MNQIILLRQTLKPLLGWHGARLNFLALFLIALIRVKTINLVELATGFRSKAKTESNYKRLKRFFRNFDLDYTVIAKAIVTLMDIPQPWAVISNEEPSLQTLWQYDLRFRVEELFLDSKSGAFELEESRIRDSKSLERLYLVVALALLFATTQGMAVQIQGLRTQVDPHWKGGLSYLKIGLRWLIMSSP